jgi:hypothetical protein
MRILLVFMFFALLACESETDSTTTELEGTWAGICIGGFSNTSSKIITVFSGNKVTYFVNNYDGDSCSNLIETIPASESSLFVSPDELPTSFVIGNEITSANGVLVKEIDFTNANGQVGKNISLLQDNGNTLYFGIPCDFSPSPCTTDRTVQINYDQPNVKIN